MEDAQLEKNGHGSNFNSRSAVGAASESIEKTSPDFHVHRDGDSPGRCRSKAPLSKRDAKWATKRSGVTRPS